MGWRAGACGRADYSVGREGGGRRSHGISGGRADDFVVCCGRGNGRDTV